MFMTVEQDVSNMDLKLIVHWSTLSFFGYNKYYMIKICSFFLSCENRICYQLLYRFEKMVKCEKIKHDNLDAGVILISSRYLVCLLSMVEVYLCIWQSIST